MHKKNIKQPLISVIIPAYNEEKYIEKCISSIDNQTYSRHEVIVVDDGSTDSTIKIVEKTRSKLIKLSHGGPGRARNIGANVARGKILAFVDADMVIDKNYLKNLVKPILYNKSHSTFSTAEYVANFENIWARCWNINSDLPENKRIKDEEKKKSVVFRAIIKDKFLELNCFDPKLGYFDDRSLDLKGLVIDSVDNAKCFHHNPDTLKDVFYSSRWIGRSINFQPNLLNLIRYSIFNSIRNSINKILKGYPLEYFIFKIVFDLGLTIGMVFKNEDNNYPK